MIFEEIQNLSVLEINNGLKDKIELKYADKSVDNVFILTANVKNNGTLSIKKDEIIAPIKITFKEKLLECIVARVNPPGIEVDLKINKDENSVECSFNLLNPLDYFTLQFVSLEKLSIPTITSRIEGLSNINVAFMNARFALYNHRILLQFLKDISYRRPLCFFFFPGLILASVSFLEGLKFLQTYYSEGHLSFVPTLLMIMLTIIGFLMCIIGTFISKYKLMKAVSSSAN